MDDKRIAVILFEELVGDPTATLDGLARHLGLPPATAWPPFKVHNPGAVRSDVHAHQSRFGRATYDELMATLAPDVSRLEAFLGRSLDLWDLSPERWCT